MTKLERARELRADTTRHYNCCQSVLIPFCRECGISEETAYRLGSQFGGGMKMGSVCGAVTGALMVLGMTGAGEERAKQFKDAFRAENGALDCAKLLALGREKGMQRKEHCDEMIRNALEQLLHEHNA